MSCWRLYVTFLFIISLTCGEIKNKGWWKNALFYQIYPRSFMDSNGDGTGDLKGIISKLENLVDIGVEAIWMSPLNSSPMVDFGYDISNYRTIDSLFGTLDDYEELIKKAHELGIKVIMDYVPNHTSDKHEWFNKSVNSVGKYKDYYVWRTGKENNTKPPNNWLSVFGGPGWTYNVKRDLWYFHQFDYRQPDLDFTNPDVRKDMEDVLKFWLDKGVNGFRIDSVPYIYENDQLLDEPLSHRPGINSTQYPFLLHIYSKDDPRDLDLILSWRKLLDDWADSHNEEERIIMTEAYTKASKYYNAGSHIPFNFLFITKLNNSSKPIDFKNKIDLWMANIPSNGVANWVTSNHDRRRITTRYENRPDFMLMLVMILPGVACVYYGEEIGMKDDLKITWEQTQDSKACSSNPEIYQTLSRDPQRTPFQWDNTTNAGFSNATETWLPINENYKELNLLKQKNEDQSPYKLFQTLAKLKNSSEILKNGSLQTDVLNNGTVLAVSRKVNNEGIVLLINFSDDVLQTVDATNYLPGTANATIVVSSTGSGVKWGSSIPVSNVELAPAVLLVLSNPIK